MSGSASLSLEQAVLGHTLAFAPMTAPTQVFVALCLAGTSPSESVRGIEASGLGYYRTPATFALATSPANMAANVAAIEFPMALAGWGTVGFFELWDAQIGGNRLYWGQLIDHASGVPATLTVTSGDIVRFSPGTLAVQAASGVGGVSSSPWLPVAGGTMTGPVTLAGNATQPLHAVPLQQLPPGVVVPPGGSIQAAIDALPTTGGMVILSPNTTYLVTAAIMSTKNSVSLSAPGWGTVIQRGPALAGIMMQLQGTGCLIDGMTFDGNGTVNTTGQAEVQISGANSRITNVQVINSAATINIAVSGAGGRVDHCTITGLGIALSTERGSGVWANNNVQVFIEDNKITGTGLDGIDVSGSGSVVRGNYVATRYWTTGGGQIVVYPNTAANAAIIVADNFVGQGGSTATGGLEIYGNNVTITGNTIVNQYGSAIGLGSGRGFVVTGNQILNVGLDMSGAQDGIVVSSGVTDFVISGNRIADDNATPNMRWAIQVVGGATDRYAITDNLVIPNSSANVRIADGASGSNKVIRDNVGADTLVPYTFTAAALTVPNASPVFQLLNSGTTAITSIAAANALLGTIKIALPNAAFIFTAGNNINNTVTTVANVPLIMACDQNGHWWLK